MYSITPTFYVDIFMSIRMKVFFFFFAVLHSLNDLSSQTRDRTWATAMKVQNPNHWELPESVLSLYNL